jgi:hypothetical protein
LSLRDGRGELACVVALGASTPVGRDAWSSAAAVRAGISAFAQHPYMIDTAGEPMQVARVPWLDIGMEARNVSKPCFFLRSSRRCCPSRRRQTRISGWHWR